MGNTRLMKDIAISYAFVAPGTKREKEWDWLAKVRGIEGNQECEILQQRKMERLMVIGGNCIRDMHRTVMDI
jgi:hypothetical protein